MSGRLPPAAGTQSASRAGLGNNLASPDAAAPANASSVPKLGNESYFAPWAQLPTGVARNVRLETKDGRFTAITPDGAPRNTDRHLRGLALPGFANTHSHAFHRALRGRTHDAGGTFWTWREAMYEVAGRLDPDNYFALATAVFAEMVLSGVTTVGEFHYVHHQPDGTPYDDPNAMGEALVQAARTAGLRLTLLDTCYLAGGIEQALDQRQLRFSDGTAAHWAERFRSHQEHPGVQIGAAIHSVRAVPFEQVAEVVHAAAGRPLHVHLSEQPAENGACEAAYGLTPTQLLDKAGALGPLTTAVHGTHLTSDDIATLGARGCTVSLCPTTERDLADGIGPARALADVGVTLTLGTDQNAVVDLFEEARAAEMNERLASRRRGRFTPAELQAMLTGHASLGWPDAGRLEVGARADMVDVDLGSVRTAGADPAQILLAASATDVRTVIIDGRVVVQDGVHRLGDVGALLRDTIRAVNP